MIPEELVNFFLAIVHGLLRPSNFFANSSFAVSLKYQINDLPINTLQ